MISIHSRLQDKNHFSEKIQYNGTPNTSKNKKHGQYSSFRCYYLVSFDNVNKCFANGQLILFSIRKYFPAKEHLVQIVSEVGSTIFK